MRRLLSIAALLATASLLFALTELETWADSTQWNTPWTFVPPGTACDTTNDWNYSATGGNTDGPCRIRTCVGRNDTSTGGHIDWTGTWEDLGVSAGNTVSTVQMTDVATKSLTWNVCDAMTIGPFELRDSADALVSTLWAGRSPTAAEGSFTAEGSQAAQSVGTLTASNASIELWLNSSHDTGNDSVAECSLVVDDLDISIEHAAAAGRNNRVIITRVRFENGKVIVLPVGD